MKFDPAEIREAAEKDFDSAWKRGVDYLERPSLERIYPRRSYPHGRPHPVFETIQRLREAYLRMGFTEMMNPVIVDAQEVYRQFGSEALAVLDRCFYIAGLPRPDVGISESRLSMIRSILGRDITAEEIEALREVLHSYKKGAVEGDDLVPEISKAINASDSQVSMMLESVFPEFRELKPEPTSRTLRSHMTSGWFISLSNLWYRSPLPVRLFSVDRCFRREQSEDAARLMSYHSASCVVMDEEMSVDEGKAISEGLLSQFGFENFRFRPDEKRSKYYVPGTQIEVYAYHPGLVGSETKYGSGWVEIATFGVYSPTALAQYDIPYPVLNLGLGVERLAMILYGSKDVRALSYPQLQPDWSLKPIEIARMIHVDKSPMTPTGKEIARSIVETCVRYGNTPSPCEFDAWEGELFGRKVRVSVVEPEENTKLCGPAYLNEIVVYRNEILGIPRTPKWEAAFEEGVQTGIRFIDAFAELAAHEIEIATIEGRDSETRVRIVRTAGEINVRIDPALERYITSYKKRIDIRGPVFTTVRSKLLQGDQYGEKA